MRDVSSASPAFQGSHTPPAAYACSFSSKCDCAISMSVTRVLLPTDRRLIHSSRSRLLRRSASANGWMRYMT